MIPFELVFSNGSVYHETKRVSSKQKLTALIMMLLEANGYTFHPFSRPVPPLLRNMVYDSKFVSYSHLANLLKRLYQYCQVYDYPCLTDNEPVVITSAGVCDASEGKPLLCVVRYIFDGSDILPVSETTAVCTVGKLAYTVKHFFDNCELTGKKILIDC